MDTDTSIPRDTPDEGRAEARPLGFWLKAVDALVDREIDAALRGEAIDRRDWHLLKALDEGAPWLQERMARKPRRIEALAYRGWATHADGGWTLTADGRAAVERLTAKVADTRERVAGAVSPEDLATTIASLEAVARELGWEEGQPLPRTHRGRRGHSGFGRGFGPHGFGHRGFEHDGFGPHDHGFPGRAGEKGRHDAGQDEGHCGHCGHCGHGAHHGGHRHGRRDGLGPWAHVRHDAA